MIAVPTIYTKNLIINILRRHTLIPKAIGCPARLVHGGFIYIYFHGFTSFQIVIFIIYSFMLTVNNILIKSTQRTHENHKNRSGSITYKYKTQVNPLRLELTYLTNK